MSKARLLIILACAVVAAIAGTLAGSLSGGAAAPRLSGSATAADIRASAAARATVAARIKRGARGPRGYRGLTGPRGATGPAGPQGPQGPADAIALPISINWFGTSSSAQNGTAGPNVIPNIGTLSTECDDSAQTITLVPASSAGTRTVADITVLQGEGTNGVSSNQEIDSYSASSPISITLPVNGMIIGTFAVQPDSGVGGPGPSPASFIFSADRKLNGTGGGGDFCSVAGQVLEHAS